MVLLSTDNICFKELRNMKNIVELCTLIDKPKALKRDSIYNNDMLF